MGNVAKVRPDITLPNGRVLTPRGHLADDLKIHDRTLARMNVPSTEFGGVIYVDRDATLQMIGERVGRRNDPVRRARAR